MLNGGVGADSVVFFQSHSFVLQHDRTLFEKTDKIYNNGVSRESPLPLPLAWVANEKFRPNDGHEQHKGQASHCVPTNMASSWGGKFAELNCCYGKTGDRPC